MAEGQLVLNEGFWERRGGVAGSRSAAGGIPGNALSGRAVFSGHGALAERSPATVGRGFFITTANMLFIVRS